MACPVVEDGMPELRSGAGTRARLRRMMQSPRDERSRIRTEYACAASFGLPSSVRAREAVQRSGRRMVRAADGPPRRVWA